MSDHSVLQQEKEIRAERLKRARLLSGLSRKAMGEGEAAIHSDTYKGWEFGRFGGLTEKGAQKVVDKLKIHGVTCSVSWLLYGLGSPPFENHAVGFKEIHFDSDASQIAKELQSFLGQEGAITLCIQDDNMAPWYLPGDLVAGLKMPSGMALKEGLDVIVQLPSGEVVLRKFHRGTEKDSYNLLTHKPDGPLITEVKLGFIAPVLWWRRPLKTIFQSSPS
jgi:hypothetical protein